MITLHIDFFASSVYFYAEIWNNNLNKFSKCGMVFDTGASMTTIDTKLALRAGYSLKNVETLSVSTPRGLMQAKRVVLRDFKLGGVELGPVMVDVVDFHEGSNIFACLGMNIIREFKTTADWDDSHEVWNDKTKRPDKYDAKIYLEPKYDIATKPEFENFTPTSSRYGLWMINRQKGQ